MNNIKIVFLPLVLIPELPVNQVQARDVKTEAKREVRRALMTWAFS